MTEIKWTRRALAHLDDIARYIADHNPQAAHRVTKRIRERVTQLADQPYLARPGRVPGTRVLFVGRYQYKVVYRVTDAIEVIAVFHTAQERDNGN